jgi:hypothetical protein
VGVTNGNNLDGLIERGCCLLIRMTRLKGARLLTVCLLAFGLSGIAYGRGGHSGHGGFHGSGGFHHFSGPHFHNHAFIGGGVFFAPSFFYPPPVYYDPPPAVQYVEPPPANSTPEPGYWYYCPGSNQYYPYTQECPGGWQPVAPQPPPS